MSTVDVVVGSDVSRSMRCRQVEALFDVPSRERQELRWTGDVPLEEREWNVGLIVGPSGCGKTTVARALFGDALARPMKWKGASVLDDFPKDAKLEDIAAICNAVGFNTIPAWLRSYDVLSNGERFRVQMARLLVESPELVVVDEFTSVVDRQVARIGAHAVQKHVRRAGTKFVAVSCHADIIEWLNPDWILDPATMAFAWRSLQPRPVIECEIAKVRFEAWRLFAPYQLSDRGAASERAMLLPVHRGGAGRVRGDAVSTAPEGPGHLGALAARDVAGLPGARARVRPDGHARVGVPRCRAAIPHLPGASGAHSRVRSLDVLEPRAGAEDAGQEPHETSEHRNVRGQAQRGLRLRRPGDGGQGDGARSVGSQDGEGGGGVNAKRERARRRGRQRRMLRLGRRESGAMVAGDVVPEEAVMLAALRRTGMTWKDARAQVDAWRAVRRKHFDPAIGGGDST